MESSLVDHSLALLNYAKKYCGLNIDQRLHHQLTTLETILYDMQNESHLNLAEMEAMSDLEVLIKLMEAASLEAGGRSVILHVRKFLVPFLDRLESLERVCLSNIYFGREHVCKGVPKRMKFGIKRKI